MMPSSDVYLNGEFLPLERARVSVMDRGFLFGDGVYEVIPAYGGRLFRLDHHLRRLENSLAAIRMDSPLSDGQWETALQRLVSQYPGQDLGVYLQVTRGPAEKRDHAIPDSVHPTVFAMASPIDPPAPGLAERGVAAVTLDDIRWQLCHIKATTLLANVLLRQQARDEDAIEAILVRDGEVTEGAASNLFIVSEGLVLTPPKGPHLLPGITRDLILELAAEEGLPCAEARIGIRQLETADEIWLTSSTREVLPVTRLNGAPVGAGVPGPLWRCMSELYQAYKVRLRGGS
ncbi:MAG: D-amino acid aminotransferase [Chromatiales bacterium]|jgi:D-alanine transaminase